MIVLKGFGRHPFLHHPIGRTVGRKQELIELQLQSCLKSHDTIRGNSALGDGQAKFD